MQNCVGYIVGYKGGGVVSSGEVNSGHKKGAGGRSDVPRLFEWVSGGMRVRCGYQAEWSEVVGNMDASVGGSGMESIADFAAEGKAEDTWV